MVVCLECEKRVERMSAFTYNHERRSQSLFTNVQRVGLSLFRFVGHHQLFGLIGGHSINQSYMSEWNEDCIYLDDGKIDSSNEIGGVGRF